MNALIGRVAYGALFCAAMPALLVVWAWRLDGSATGFWPQPFPAWVGLAALTCGSAIMATAMRALWVRGQGLPMNAYPTTRFVSTSFYSIIAHPIYLAFVLMVAGTSVLTDSPAGLWLVTPTAALAAVALVAGYEGPKLRERFGSPLQAPWLGLPLGGDYRPSMARRLAAGLVALGPWALAYCLFSTLPAPTGAADLRMAWEAGVPRPEWALWLYTAAYPLVLAAPLVAATGYDLRRFVRGAWLVTVVGFFVMLMLPGVAQFLPVEYSPVGRWVTQANRVADATWLAFPSFHAAWAVFAACALSLAAPRLRLAWWCAACGIAASCVLTGSHAIVDVLGGVGLGWLCWHHDIAWRAIVQAGELMSNSWASIRLGPVRFISHALWSALAAMSGALLTLYLAGQSALWPLALALMVGFLSAGAWGYFLEGGGRLSRPFGYYGYLLGTMLALALMAVAGVAAIDRLCAAMAAAAAVAQAIGRLRCLVQGCCHGRAVVAAYGFRVTHPESRVVALGHLSGVPIHPSQLHSLIANAFLAVLLLRLWNAGTEWALIVGLYLLLSSLARFVEEQYRGEPQTARRFGLSIYQWLAIAFGLCGLLLSMIHGPTVEPAQWCSVAGYSLAAATALAAALLMSVDFPDSARRFSRLTVRAK